MVNVRQIIFLTFFRFIRFFSVEYIMPRGLYKALMSIPNRTFDGIFSRKAKIENRSTKWSTIRKGEPNLKAMTKGQLMETIENANQRIKLLEDVVLSVYLGQDNKS